MNMVQHIILLHKVLYGYVTFFDVYECAISPPKLQKRIEEGRCRFETRHYVCVAPAVYANEKTGAALSEFGFAYNEEQGMYWAPASAKLEELLTKPDADIEYERVTVEPPSELDDTKRQQLEAIERWYFD